MSEEVYEQKIIEGYLQEVIFNVEKLDEIKGEIKKISEGDISPKEFRGHIVDFLYGIFNEFRDGFPFFANQVNKKKDIDDFSKNSSQIANEIMEKNKFLEVVRLRLEDVINKVESKGIAL